ncbi:acyltransferase family protein [Clostridium gasigenes]|uniref:acyltransferase family protein n=1 Tax=Clostridium gasigenes TaxID=94869 RepID=UPI0014383515|nr:acyltransferase family protein [Clostridium gasigenes]NKF08518.1 acyltransferase [Clostridium gasigenes]QSW21330.1 acyltransferase family protein [Clostridium gasigenes]
MYFGLLCIIILLVSLISIKKNNSRKDFSFDKICTNHLKGLAIIMVILSHLNGEYGHFQFMKYFGTIGVSMFLFSAGYGLTKSYQKNGLSNFFSKRIRIVLLPYSIVTILWLFVDSLLGAKYSFKLIVTAIIGFDLSRTIDSTMWYIAFIISWYVVFYFVFKFILNDKLKIVALFGASIISVVICIFNIAGDGSAQWGTHAVIFPMGPFYALYGEKIIQKYKFKIVITTMIILSLGIIIIKNIPFNTVQFILYDIFFMILIIFSIIILRYFNLKSLFLEKVGSYSYELYLFEGYLIKKIVNPNFFNNDMITLFIYVMLVIFLSYILKRLMCKIQGREKKATSGQSMPSI